MDSKTIALFSAIIGSVLISFSAVFVTSSQHGPAITGFYRMIFASMIFGFLSVIKLESWPTRSNGLARLVFVGFFFALDLTLWHRSIPYLGVGLATLLNNFQVFFVLGFAALLGKSPFTKEKAFIVMTSALGLSLLCKSSELSSSATFGYGIFWGLASAACYSFSLINLHKLSTKDDLGKFSRLAVMSASAACFLLLEGLVNGESLLFTSWCDFLTLAGYSLSSQVIAWFLITSSMKKLDESTVALSLLTQPCFSYSWDVIFYGKSVGIGELAGVVMIIVSIWKGKSG